MNGPIVAQHVRTRTVLVGDDDASGLLYFPVVYQYMSEGEQEIFGLLGRPTWGQIDDGVASPAVHTECDYISATRAGDVLTHTLRVRLGNHSSMGTEHEFTTRDGKLALRGRIVRAWVELATMSIQPVPQWLRSRQPLPGQT